MQGDFVGEAEPPDEGGYFHAQVVCVRHCRHLASHFDKLGVVHNALRLIAAGDVDPQGWLAFATFHRAVVPVGEEKEATTV